MKKIFVIILMLIFATSSYAEFQMERIICTTKKTTNCGAYIYNTITGEVYFCDSEECKEVKTPIEVFIDEEIEEVDSKKVSKIPKKPTTKKESKIPKKPTTKKESKIPKKPKDKCDKKSLIPKKGCT